MRGAQVLEDVVDEGAAVGVEVVGSQQHVKAVQRGLAAVARVLDRIDRVEVAREAHDLQDAVHVVERGVGEHELHAAEALERELERVRRERRVPRSLALAELVGAYLGRRDVQPVPIAKVRWLLG
jgi:hypothetical protein